MGAFMVNFPSINTLDYTSSLHVLEHPIYIRVFLSGGERWHLKLPIGALLGHRQFFYRFRQTPAVFLAETQKIMPATIYRAILTQLPREGAHHTHLGHQTTTLLRYIFTYYHLNMQHFWQKSWSGLKLRAFPVLHWLHPLRPFHEFVMG